MTDTSKTKWTELCAWAAGLFEGEGCVYLKHRPATEARSARLDATVSMSNTEFVLLRRLQENWGGSIHRHKMTPKNRKQLYMWQIYSNAMEKFLRDIRPFVVACKAEKIDKAFELRARQRLEGRPRDNMGRIARLPEEELQWRSKLKL